MARECDIPVPWNEILMPWCQIPGAWNRFLAPWSRFPVEENDFSARGSEVSEIENEILVRENGIFVIEGYSRMHADWWPLPTFLSGGRASWQAGMAKGHRG